MLYVQAQSHLADALVTMMRTQLWATSDTLAASMRGWPMWRQMLKTQSASRPMPALAPWPPNWPPWCPSWALPAARAVAPADTRVVGSARGRPWPKRAPQRRPSTRALPAAARRVATRGANDRAASRGVGGGRGQGYPIGAWRHDWRLDWRLARGARGLTRGLIAALHQLAAQRLLDERARVVHPVELDEAAKARALRLTEQHLVNGTKPEASMFGKAVRLAGLIDNRLQRLCVGARARFAQCVLKRRKRRALGFGGQAVGFRGLDEVVIVAKRVTGEL